MLRRPLTIAAVVIALALTLRLTLDAGATGPTISQTITSGSTLTGIVHWQAYPSGGPVPRVEFYVDGVARSRQDYAPYCYAGDATCAIDTRSLSDGAHTFRVAYVDRSSGAEVASDSASATVDNSTPTTASWNPYVTRWPVVKTTIADLKGDGTEAGGAFPNHLSDEYPRSRTPGQPIPAEIPDSVALVEIDDVTTTPVDQPFGAGIGDGDGVDNLVDPRTGERLHAEISREWGTIRMPDGSIRGPFLDPYPAQTVWPAAGTHVDVQGFVRWDIHHGWWELHPVTAWRLHATGASSTGTAPRIEAQTLRQSIASHLREEASASR